MPSRAFCILFGKLPHVLSAAIQRPTHTRVRQHRLGKVRLRTYAARWERRTQITRRILRGVRERCITGYDYWWLSPAIDVQASGCTHATCISMASGRRVHATDAQIPDHLSPSPCAKEGTILSRDGCSIRQASQISRATRRDANVDSLSDDLATTQLNALQRACGSTSSVASHSSLEKRRDYVDRPPRKSEHLTMKRHRLTAYRWHELGHMDVLWIYEIYYYYLFWKKSSNIFFHWLKYKLHLINLWREIKLEKKLINLHLQNYLKVDCNVRFAISMYRIS